MSKLQIVLSRMRARGGAAAILLSAALLFGADAGAQENVVRIGVVGPLTGDLAYGGQSQLRGAQLAAAEYNASQKNFKIEVIGEDDESKCDRAVAATRKLIARDKVVAILGNWFSTCSLAMVPITAQAKVPQYTVGIASPITQQGSEWIFRMALKTAVLNDAVIDHVVGKIGMRRIAILSSNEEVGKSLVDTTEKALKRHGLTPIAKEEFGRGDKDFSGQLGRIRALNPEGVIMGTGFQEMAIIARQFRELNVPGRLLGGDPIAGSARFLQLSGKHVEGLIFATPFIPVVDNPRIGAFVKAHQQQFSGDVPENWAAQMYDAVGMIAEAIKANGNKADPTQIRDFTKSFVSADKSYRGLIGNLYFDKFGDGSWQPIIGEVERAVPPKWKILGGL